MRIAYVRKMTRDQITTLNAAWVGQFTSPLTTAVPLRSYDGGDEGVETFTVYDIPAALRGVVNNVTGNVPASAAGGAANYDTIEIAFNMRLGGSLYLDSGMDMTWKDDLRSPANTSNSPLTQADPIAAAYFENPYPSVSARQRSSVWEAHASSRYELPYGVGVGANVRVQSGWNYARVISVALPNAGTQRFWLEPIDNHRSPTVPLINVRVDRTFDIGRYKLTAMLDAFNVINSSAVTNFNLVNGASFDQINGALDPRTVQVGVRFAF